jgi:hypothetical protein
MNVQYKWKGDHMGFFDKLKNEFLSESDQKKLGEMSRKVKKELSLLPIVSVIGDATQGVAGVNEIKKNLEANPGDPKAWLFYYESVSLHSKLKSGVGIARAIVNPVGFIIGKSVATGLNTVDDEYKHFNPKDYLGMVIAIVSKKIKNKSVTPAEIVLYAKAQFYLAGTYPNNKNRDKLLEHAVKNMILAIELEKNAEFKAEYFFYLAEMYKLGDKNELYLRCLNLSRKLGFGPAIELLTKELASKLTDLNEKNRFLEEARVE